MDNKKVKLYFCIFDAKKPCSVRTEFKLNPESLVEFCKVCAQNHRMEIVTRLIEDTNAVPKKS